MDCFVCNTRSAVESCSKCQALLCEECGLVCAKCGARICPDHSYRTHKGRILCLPCQELRKARRSGKFDDQAAVAEKALEALEAGSEDEAGEGEVLLASVRQPTPPWKLSLYTASAGLILVLVLIFIPNLRRFTLPWGGFFPTPYLFLVIPAVAFFWSGVGLLGKDYVDGRKNCWYGIVLGLAATVLIFVAVHTDPARVAEQKALDELQQRNKMSTEQMRQWREQKLDKFRQ